MIFFWAETPDGWAIPGIHGCIFSKGFGQIMYK